MKTSNLKLQILVMLVGPSITLPQKFRLVNIDHQKYFHLFFQFIKASNIIKVITGSKYNTTADVWSLACMLFEMLTGDFLFEPRKGPTFSKNDDHLA